MNKQKLWQYRRRLSVFMGDRQWLTACIIACVAFIMRHPFTVLHPQFWAEDGRVFFLGAYQQHFSLATIALPYAGYFQLYPRLIALLGIVVNITYMPLVFSLTALLAQVLPVAYFWSKRFSVRMHIVPKLLITACYVLLPFTQEISGNLTNAQWYLALAAFLILFTDASKKRWVTIADGAVLLLASLSGPFSILLTPIALAAWWLKKNRTTGAKLVIVGVCAGLNTISTLLMHGRGSGFLGVSITKLFDIIGGQVFGTALFGSHSLSVLLSKPWITPMITVLGIEFMVYVFMRSQNVLRLFMVFAALVLAAGMLFPTSVNSPGGLWAILAGEGATARYFFLLHIAFFTALVWTISTPNPRVLKAACIGLLVLAAAIGIPRDFYSPVLPDLHYQRYAREFNALPSGESLRIPLNPSSGWDIILQKR